MRELRNLAYFMAAMFAVVLIGSATANAKSYSQKPPAHNVIPIQASFVNPPWVFEWGQVVTYRLKLTPHDIKTTMYGEVLFQGFAIDVPGYQTATVPKQFSLRPGDRPLIITIRFAAPSSTVAMPLPIDAQWCADATLLTEGVPQQLQRTCSSHDTGK